jgi:hypothetical protein
MTKEFSSVNIQRGLELAAYPSSLTGWTGTPGLTRANRSLGSPRVLEEGGVAVEKEAVAATGMDGATPQFG